MNYVKRLLVLPTNRSFFLFGARNTGKSTLLKHTFKEDHTFWVDLLDPELEEKYARNPKLLQQEVNALDDSVTHIVIDEVQKIPKLLDIVHQLIESTNKCFVMTGSSARKLRHGGANLLAGRAFVYYLHPFSCFEREEFQLEEALRWGQLPSLTHRMETDEEKSRFLQAYSQTYLREEIWLEQFIRKIDPFRKFLEVSAQCNGQILNISSIAHDVGVDDKTIKQYFSILEDTLMGYLLEPYSGSFRKRLHSKPKFYYFDTGVCRTLSRRLSIPLLPHTSDYGNAFEHFIILEALKLSHYFNPEYRFSYLKTKDDVEVDLIVERPGKKTLCIEIKSSDQVRDDKMVPFSKIAEDMGNSEAICISRESQSRKVGGVLILPWKEALDRYFRGKS